MFQMQHKSLQKDNKCFFNVRARRAYYIYAKNRIEYGHRAFKNINNTNNNKPNGKQCNTEEERMNESFNVYKNYKNYTLVTVKGVYFAFTQPNELKPTLIRSRILCVNSFVRRAEGIMRHLLSFHLLLCLLKCLYFVCSPVHRRLCLSYGIDLRQRLMMVYSSRHSNRCIIIQTGQRSVRHALLALYRFKI